MQTNNKNFEDILKEFLTNAYGDLSYFEFLRLLRVTHSKYNNFEKLFQDLDIEPHLSLNFPAADIQSFEQNNNIYSMRVNFLGLYGVSSSLPLFDTQDLIEDEKENKIIVKDFYNIFNKRKYKQYFDAHLKYDLSLRIVENSENAILDILYSFIGQNNMQEHDTLKYFSKYELLKYTNILMHTNKSPYALSLLIKNLLKVEVQIEQFIGSYEFINEEQLSQLGGQNSFLGEDIHLGDKILDFHSYFGVLLKNLNKEQFDYFSIGNEGFYALKELIHLYIGNQFKYKIKYQLKSNYPNLCLGDPRISNLGINSFIGNSNYINNSF